MGQTATAPGSVEQLTPRQREVLALLARGATNFEIAQALGISLEGAKYHVREIMGRLGVDSREDAADWWREERKPAARARRGLGWLLPRLIVAAAFLGAIAFAGVVVAFGIAAGGGGGRPAAAYVAACGEGDVKLEMDSRLRSAEETGAAPAVLITVRFEPSDEDCYVGGDLSLSPQGAAPATSEEAYEASRLSGSARLDTILDGGGTVTFTIANWCGEDARPIDLTARLRGTQLDHRIDYPAEPCPSPPKDTLCFLDRDQPIECPPSQPSIAHGGPGTVRTMDLLPRCDPQRILVGINSNPRAMQVPEDVVLPALADMPWRGRAMYENTAFAVTWSVAERPLDCEFQSGVTLRLLDLAGEEVQVDQQGANGSILARFRRGTAPTGGADRLIHLPDTGGNGDYATETSVLTHLDGGQFIWANWCGEDRAPVTLEVTAASGRAKATLERPPCLDAAQPSVLFSGVPFEAP